MLFRYLRSECRPPPEAMNPVIKRSGWKAPSDTGLWSISEKLHQHIRDIQTGEQLRFMDSEMGFFDQVTSISGILKPIPSDERRTKIEQVLRTIPLERNDLYIPTNPESIVTQVICESGTPMPSKEKMPILVQFQVMTEDDPSEPPHERKQVTSPYLMTRDVSAFRLVFSKWVMMCVKMSCHCRSSRFSKMCSLKLDWISISVPMASYPRDMKRVTHDLLPDDAIEAC